MEVINTVELAVAFEPVGPGGLRARCRDFFRGSGIGDGSEGEASDSAPLMSARQSRTRARQRGRSFHLAVEDVGGEFAQGRRRATKFEW